MSDPDGPSYWDHEDDRAEPWPPPDPAEPGALMMATPELLELARAVRGHDWSARLAPALVAAVDAGWDWARRGRTASLLIFDPEGDPRSITEAARNPVQRVGGPSAPSSEYRKLREARQRLEQSRAAGESMPA
jgi:hypothetical protein